MAAPNAVLKRCCGFQPGMRSRSSSDTQTLRSLRSFLNRSVFSRCPGWMGRRGRGNFVWKNCRSSFKFPPNENSYRIVPPYIYIYIYKSRNDRKDRDFTFPPFPKDTTAEKFSKLQKSIRSSNWKSRKSSSSARRTIPTDKDIGLNGLRSAAWVCRISWRHADVLLAQRVRRDAACNRRAPIPATRHTAGDI